MERKNICKKCGCKLSPKIVVDRLVLEIIREFREKFGRFEIYGLLLQLQMKDVKRVEHTEKQARLLLDIKLQLVKDTSKSMIQLRYLQFMVVLRDREVRFPYLEAIKYLILEGDKNPDVTSNVELARKVIFKNSVKQLSIHPNTTELLQSIAASEFEF